MVGALAGVALSAAGGGAGGGVIGSVIGGALGGGAGGNLVGDLLGGLLGGDEGGAKSNPLDPLGLGLPSPLELLQQGPTMAEQLLNNQSPLDMLLGGGQSPLG